jgi:hypothetical protein
MLQPCTCYLKQADKIGLFIFIQFIHSNIAMEVDYIHPVSVLINSSEDVSDDSSAEDENFLRSIMDNT